MQFMCLIYADPAVGPQPGTEAFGPFMHGYQAFTEAVTKDGKMLHADALQGVETATSVSVRGGKTEIMDGPFAETKEHLGGYYLLECENLDEAVKYAAQIPTAEHGRIEVRPVMVWDS
jgi:hypothetical protein